MLCVLQVGAFMIFASPPLICPLDLDKTAHDICFADVTVGRTATWAKVAREPRWVDIYLPLNRCS